MEKEKNNKKSKKILKLLITIFLILILLIIVYINLYNKSNSLELYSESMYNLYTQEREAFNKSWQNYEGKNKGPQVKALINRLMVNANHYQEEPEKILTIILKKDNVKTIIKFEENNLEQYINQLKNKFKEILVSESYNISYDYNDINLINTVIIRKEGEELTEEELELKDRFSIEELDTHEEESRIKEFIENISKIDILWFVVASLTTVLIIFVIICIKT